VNTAAELYDRATAVVRQLTAEIADPHHYLPAREGLRRVVAVDAMTDQAAAAHADMLRSLDGLALSGDVVRFCEVCALLDASSRSHRLYIAALNEHNAALAERNRRMREEMS
jgi:hypothetical protein